MIQSEHISPPTSISYRAFKLWTYQHTILFSCHQDFFYYKLFFFCIKNVLGSVLSITFCLLFCEWNYQRIFKRWFVTTTEEVVYTMFSRTTRLWVCHKIVYSIIDGCSETRSATQLSPCNSLLNGSVNCQTKSHL